MAPRGCSGGREKSGGAMSRARSAGRMRVGAAGRRDEPPEVPAPASRAYPCLGVHKETNSAEFGKSDCDHSAENGDRGATVRVARTFLSVRKDSTDRNVRATRTVAPRFSVLRLSGE